MSSVVGSRTCPHCSGMLTAMIQRTFCTYVYQKSSSCLKLKDNGIHFVKFYQERADATVIFVVLPMIYPLRDESQRKANFMQNMIEDRTESALSYYEFLLHLQQQISK